MALAPEAETAGGVLAFSAHELHLLREAIVRALVRAGAAEDAEAGGLERGRGEHERALHDAELDEVIADTLRDFLRERERRSSPEGELARLERRYTALFESSPDAIFVSRGAKVVLANRACAALLGARDAGELIGRSPLELFHPECHEAIRARSDAVARGERAQLDLGKIVRLDGEARDVEVVATAFPERDGTAVQVVLRDVTERARAEQELRASEERFRTLAQAMPQIVCVLGWDGLTVEYVNSTWTAYSGLDAEASTRAGLDGIVHPDDHEAARACFRRARETQLPQDVEVRYRAADGSYRWYLSRLAPVVAEGRVVRFVGAAMDIEDRRRAEEAARLADRRKDDFLAVLSHELRNPLAPIRNSVYLLEHGAGADQRRRAQDVIRRQAEHLTRLVDDLLDITRISRGKIVLRRARVDLRELLRDTADDLRSLFAQSDVALRVACDAGPIWIDADPTRIAQVLGNLLQNAVKFTPPGGSVSATVTASDGRAVATVRDTGIGMDPAQVERMFDPFTQADEALARTKGGLGLGLALVKGLVALHGGTVTARSEGVGRGAEFALTLPLLTDGPAASRDRTAAIPEAQRRTVLVVEDNVDAGETLAEILTLGGHRVQLARDGRSAIALARELRPDVVLCDIGLPDVDGYEGARLLRGDEALRATRLIALSGYAQPEDVERAREAGFDEHVAKPPPLDRLNALVGGASGR